MTAFAIDRIEGRRDAWRGTRPAVRMLQIFAVSIMVIPSDTVLKVIGAGGYVAALLAYLLFLAYLAGTLFGLHDPLAYRHPVRMSLCMLWLCALLSYALMDRTMLSSIQQSSADRWLIQLAGVSGVVLVTAEYLRSLDQIHRVLRVLVWSGVLCCLVAILQFLFTLNVTDYLRALPGFSIDQAVGVPVIGSRGGLNRVAGTASNAIEFGVVAGMLLPLAVYLALHDTERSAARRWFPVICIAAAVPTSISRAAVLSVTLAMGVLVISLRPSQRLMALAAIPLALAAVYVASPRLIGTFQYYIFAGTSDDSIAHRIDNYPYAEHLIRQNLLFGQGGGTYVSGNYIDLALSHILDNQYLDTAIELGLVGLAALVFYLLRPVWAALAARRRTSDRRLRDLCAALAGSALAALACSATFDSFSFPMFLYVQALVAGLIGAAWLLVNRADAAAHDAYLPGREPRSSVPAAEQHWPDGGK
jgi:O-antigen ligase